MFPLLFLTLNVFDFICYGIDLDTDLIHYYSLSDTIISIMRPEENETIKEGKNVSLICENNCTSEVIWFKNNEPLPERASVIFFSDISSHDSGNYSCATKHHSSSLSDVFRISVEYEPKNTSVSVRPAPEVIRGSNVTLTCSSNANPAVDIFLWYKIDGDHCLKMGSQAKLQLNNAETAHSGHYFCVVSNKHGRQNSTVLTLKVLTTFSPNIFFMGIYFAFKVSTILFCLFLCPQEEERSTKNRPRRECNGDNCFKCLPLSN
uniref:Ig-like domain-containing protein n=1 Tax=Esox lucius TaxID=8010 RepID=A0A3P8YCR9_ESOLU